MYSSSNSPIPPKTSNLSKHRTLTTTARKKTDSNQYIRGIVLVAPQNESVHGWIYSKSNNAMYQLPFDANKHYIPQQIVLFKPTS